MKRLAPLLLIVASTTLLATVPLPKGFKPLPNRKMVNLLAVQPTVQTASYTSKLAAPRWLTLVHGDTTQKTIALTFDDGPHTKYTEQLLDILDRYHVKATFFVVGKMAEKNPDLILDEYRRGHIVANHSYDHPNLIKLPYYKAWQEYDRCSDVIQRITGERPRYCRPPGGEYNDGVLHAALSNGMTTCLWTDDPGDWICPGSDVIAKETMRKISNGGIVLLHDGVQQTLDILPNFITTLQKRGYKFVTMDELENQANRANSHRSETSKKLESRSISHASAAER